MMHVESCSMTEADASVAAEKMADFFGPAQIDQAVRQALQFCWLVLPKERRNAEELERQFRRIVERALKDFREDCQAFGRTV
jgi:hypothetical protein